MIIRNDVETTDRRIDAIESFDERSKEFPVTVKLDSLRELRKLEPISKIHLISTILDQKDTGGCCGFSGTHLLLAEPMLGKPSTFTADFAKEKLYFPAQKIDSFPGGEYPGAEPVMQGTTLLSVLKIMKDGGYISGYNWAFSFEDFILALGYIGPCMLATHWYSNMLGADRYGRVEPGGSFIGRHAYMAYGVDPRGKRILFANSWGRTYGIEGRFWMTFNHTLELLRNRGEAVFPFK